MPHAKQTFDADVAAVRERLAALEVKKAEAHAAERAAVERKLRKIARKKEKEVAERRKAAAEYRAKEAERRKALRKEAEQLRRRLHMRRSDSAAALESSGDLMTTDDLTSDAVSTDDGDGAAALLDSPDDDGDGDYSDDTDLLDELGVYASPRLARTSSETPEAQAEIRAALKELQEIKRARILRASLRLQGLFRGERERKVLAAQGLLPTNGVFQATPLITDTGLELPRVLVARPQPYAAAHLQFEVNACDLRTLVELLTHPGTTLAELARIILLTHTNFVSSHTLVTLLALRFETMPQAGIPGFVKRILPGIQAKVFEFLHMWITDFFVSFADPEAPATTALVAFLDRVRALHTCYCSSTMRKVAKHLRRLLMSQAKKHARERYLGPLTASEAAAAPQSILVGSSPITDFSVLHIHALEVARQLTLLDFAPFYAIQHPELLKQAWCKEGAEEKAPNVLAVIDRFNHEVAWASTEILRRDSTEARAYVICLLLDVASNLAVLQNYSGLMAILSALQSAEIDRLKYTWERVPEEYISIFGDLKQIMNMSFNYRQYRDTLRKIKPPAVPYIGVLLQDLTFIDDGNEKKLPTPEPVVYSEEALAADPDFRALLFPSRRRGSIDTDSDSDDDEAVLDAGPSSRSRASDDDDADASSASPAPPPPAPDPLKVLYNIDKQRMNYRAIHEILEFQDARYVLHPTDSVIEYILSVDLLDANARYARSLALEERNMKEPSRKARVPVEHHAQEGSERPELEIIDAHFMDDLTAVMTLQNFEPGVPIVTAGEIGSEMYFVREGMVTVELATGKSFDLNRGAFFGEVALFLEQVRSATVRAKSATTVLTLAKRDLDEVLKKYPDMFHQFKRLARARLESDKQGPSEMPKWLRKVQASM